MLLEQLPRDLHMFIASILSPQDTVRTIRRLNKYFNRISKEEFLWKQYLKETPLYSQDDVKFLLGLSGQSLEWQWRACAHNLCSEGVSFGYRKDGTNVYYLGGNSMSQTAFGILKMDQEIHVGYRKHYLTSGQAKAYDMKGNLIYEGEFRRGERSGSGKSYRDGKVVYEGLWLYNMPTDSN